MARDRIVASGDGTFLFFGALITVGKWRWELPFLRNTDLGEPGETMCECDVNTSGGHDSGASEAGITASADQRHGVLVVGEGPTMTL